MLLWELPPGEAAMDIAGWLRALGLEKYQATFCEHEITAVVRAA